LEKYLLAVPLKSDLASYLSESIKAIESLGTSLVTMASMHGIVMAGKIWYRPQQMPFHDILKEKYFPAISGIYKFCRDEYQQLDALGYENLTGISNITAWERFASPPNMIQMPIITQPHALH
jgi:hypothetical protein